MAQSQCLSSVEPMRGLAEWLGWYVAHARHKSSLCAGWLNDPALIDWNSVGVEPMRGLAEWGTGFFRRPPESRAYARVG